MRHFAALTRLFASSAELFCGCEVCAGELLRLRSTKKCKNHTLQFHTDTLGFLAHTLMESARLPFGEYQGIYVGFSADCNGIAQLFSNLFYCGDDAGAEGAFCWRFRQWGIQHQLKRPQRSAPCPEILGGEFGTHGFARVAVYVLRAYGMGLARLIQVFEKMLTA